jgi:hypothetical protein
MVRYTVIVPLRDATEAVAQLLPRLERVLDRLLLPYEIICVNDGSHVTHDPSIASVLENHARVRVLSFEQRRGTSAALTAGIAAARGDVLVCASPDTTMAIEGIPDLISRLSRYELVVAEPERRLAGHLRAGVEHMVRVVRAADRGLREELLFAARREALAGMTLPRGGFRLLPELVRRRGMRACRVTLAAGLPPRGEAWRSTWLDRLAAGWIERRFEPHLARERAPGIPTSRPTVARAERIGAALARPATPPVEHQHGKSS